MKFLNSIYPSLLAIIISSTIFPTNLIQAQNILSIEEMVDRANVIIIGDVTSLSCQWDKEKAKIWTFVTIKCTDHLKYSGEEEKQNEITFRLLGGVVEDIGMEVSGAPKFELSEHVLVFLEQDFSGNYAVVEWAAGKYTLSDGYWVNNSTKYSDSLISDIKNIVNKQP
jgi:hypothetical protein